MGFSVNSGIDATEWEGFIDELRKSLDVCFIKIIRKLCEFFNDDFEKVYYWLYTDNPLLGNIKPMVLISAGRGHKVLQMIENAEEGYLP